MNTKTHLDTPFSTARSARVALSAAGFSLVEMMIVVAVASVMTVLTIPRYTATMTSMHLGSAASSLAGAIQSARYQAIATGCAVQIAVSAQSYQLSAVAMSGTPPSCPTSGGFTAVGGSITFASSEISQSPTPQTLQMNANGTVTAAYTTTPTAPIPFSLTLTPSNGTATKTVSVSGVGYVKVQ
jgi:type IV fimbrial biogenesis protein FimT